MLGRDRGAATLALCRISASGVALACGLVFAAPAMARDKGPELSPLECPIEGAVRVASGATLKHFSGLLANCDAMSVIVSPATTVNRAPGEVRSAPVGDVPQDTVPVQRQGAEGGFILADSRGGKGKPADGKPQVKVERSPDGSWVSITPPAPPPSAVVVEAAPAAGETLVALDGEAETILALRPRSYATQFDEEIAAAARRHQVDPLLLHAVITQESRYQHNAVSHAGARGLMQVMPQTGRGLGVRDARHLFDPRTNIDAGARLLKQLWTKYDGRMDLVLAAYNAGEGAVQRYGMRVPPFRETQDYVLKVKAIYTKLAGESGYLAVLD